MTGKSLSFLLAATISSQFVEISHDTVHLDGSNVYVGDDVTLKCSLVDDAQDSKDVTNYVWYLDSESHENRNFIDFFFFSTQPPRFVSFFHSFLPAAFFLPHPSALVSERSRDANR